MNASYKIALVVAVGLLIVVAGYYATRTSDTPEPVSDVSNATDPPAVAVNNTENADTDETAGTPPRRPATPPAQRGGPETGTPQPPRNAGPTGRTGPVPRTPLTEPGLPETDPSDRATQEPAVVDLGPAPAGLPRSLAEARGLGSDTADDRAPTTDATPAPGPADEVAAVEEPALSPERGTDASSSPDAQPDTAAPVESGPATTPSPSPQPAERTEPAPRPDERAPDNSGIPATYTIAAGDMLVTIAERFYGTQAAWEAIAQANPTIDPTRLSIGDVLRLPRPDTVDRPRTEPPAPTPGRRDVYTVQPGDNLYRIAQRFYNDAEKWDVIYNHNRDIIGDDPAKLREGMTLVIPPAVGGAN